jgi:cytochrome b involved in lipid metabolism
VYDVTPFMEEHPGGDEVLLAVRKVISGFSDRETG